MATGALSALDLKVSNPDSPNLDFCIEDRNSGSIVTGKINGDLDAPEAEEFSRELFSILISGGEVGE